MDFARFPPSSPHLLSPFSSLFSFLLCHTHILFPFQKIYMHKYLCKSEYVLEEIQISELVSNIGNTICVDDLFLPFLHRKDIFTPLSLLPSGNRFYHVLALFFFFSLSHSEAWDVRGGREGRAPGRGPRGRPLGVLLEGCWWLAVTQRDSKSWCHTHFRSPLPSHGTQPMAGTD